MRTLVTILRQRDAICKAIAWLLFFGLHAVGMNIYTCGSHGDLNNTYPVVYDERPDMWYCCASEFQDTKTKV
jgi:hypothetical protein